MRRSLSCLAWLTCVVSFVHAAHGDGVGSPAALGARLTSAEYGVSRHGAVLSGPNRAQNLRVTFGADGVAFVPRSGRGTSFTWLLRFAAFGRGSALAAPADAPFVADGNRVTANRDGITEWYVNDARGLEQGFTFAKRPAGNAPLCVEVAIDGDASATIEATDSAGSAIECVGADGAVQLRLDHLVAFDASGRVLAATMHVRGRSVRIEVDDADASYPLTIDPLATSPVWAAESNQANAQFGIASGTAGDVNGDGFSDVIVGAAFYDNGQTDEGAAFVYLGSAGGLALTPAWTAESDDGGAFFGVSVGTAGDVNGDGFVDVIVGAQHAENGETQEGRAYVYLGSAAGLSTVPAWIAESNQAFAAFGRDVGSAGDVNGDGFSDVIVGAVGFSNGQGGEGAAFVYHGSAAGLGATPAWAVESNQAQARFGESVDTAGDVNADGFSDVVVGAEWFDNGESNEGRAFLYLGSAGGLATSAAWTAESNQGSAAFGHAVGMAGDVNGDGFADVVAGAHQYDNGESNEGRAYLYLGAASGLAASPVWTMESNVALAVFGNAIGTAGDVNGDGFADVVIGSEAFSNGQTSEGRVFLFEGSTNDLPHTVQQTFELDLAVSNLGASVGTAGDVNGDGFADVIAGASRFDGGQTDEGAAFVWLGKGSPPKSTPTLLAEGNQSLATQGNSVASAGDINGDGFADIVVGTSFWDNGFQNEGRFVVYPGSATGPSIAAAQPVVGSQANAMLGYSVNGAGDVNSDGFADVIVTAWTFDNGQQDEGAAYIHLGSLAGLVATPAWQVESNQAFANMSAADSAGDVNGDGFADVIVGVQHASGGGFANVYLGSPTGPSTNATWTAQGSATSGGFMAPQFGVSVAGAGDVNADGFCDVIVGSNGFDNGQSDEGRALVYLGNANGLNATPVWAIEGNLVDEHFGSSVDTAGDVNGDGFSDVIVGSGLPFTDGHALIFLGTASGVTFSAPWNISGSSLSEFGTDVSTAGDVNGDGFSDVLVGAPYFTNDQVNEGRAYLYLGSSFGPTGIASWTGEGTTAAGEFGRSLGTAGDTNGDGYSDIVIGFPLYGSGSLSGQGAAWVYLGNNGVGNLAKPQQRRADDSKPIVPLSRTLTNSFLAKLHLRSPFGRGDVRLAVESKPLGVPFDGTGLVRSSFADATGAGVDAAVTIAGLTANTPYHWRARVEHAASTTPFSPWGPWFSTGDNGAGETDIRTDCCGGILGAAAAYGSGKPGTPGIPILSSTVPPALGALGNVTIVGAKPNAGPVLLFVGFSTAAIPFDGGTLLVNPTWTLTLPSVNPIGALQLPIQISPSIAQCGLHAYFQAFIVDPGAVGFYHTSQTNGLDWTLGS